MHMILPACKKQRMQTLPITHEYRCFLLRSEAPEKKWWKAVDEFLVDAPALAF